MVDILCSSCSGTALSVPEVQYGNFLEGYTSVGGCVSCGANGRVSVCGENDDALIFQIDADDEPIHYTVGDLFGELERQVSEERERQHSIVWETPQGGFANHRRVHSAAHAKRLRPEFLTEFEVDETDPFHLMLPPPRSRVKPLLWVLVVLVVALVWVM